jgi:surfeit locus 1 family protein
MSRRGKLILTLAIPLALASVFIRLGVWQVSRLGERRDFNRLLSARLVAEPVDLYGVTPDTSAGHYRRVTVEGRFDFAHQIVYAGRSRQGSPGVYLITPLRLPGSDTVVMVNRGWVYSPDAGSVNESRWQEGDSAKITGYLETFTATDPRTNPSRPRRLHALNRVRIEELAGAPIAPYLIVRTDTAAAPPPSAADAPVDSTPARLGMPILDEGSHQSYAFQWFAFATIAIVGGVALAIKSR